MSVRYFYGWNVVGATFVMALLSFGLGFYGLTVYVATLQRLYGWSAFAVSAPVTVYYVTTAAAVIGRLATGAVVDRVSRRLVSSATLVTQIVGLAWLAWPPSAAGVYAGCALFGLGVGNLTTLPGLILAVEWPRERFGALVGLVVGINQFTFAFGPSLVGVMRDWAGTYGPALGACATLQAVAAALVLLGPGRVIGAARL